MDHIEKEFNKILDKKDKTIQDIKRYDLLYTVISQRKQDAIELVEVE